MDKRCSCPHVAHLFQPATKLRNKRILDGDFFHEKKFVAFYYFQFCVHSDKKKMLEELTRDIHQSPNKEKIVSELAQCIASGIFHSGCCGICAY